MDNTSIADYLDHTLLKANHSKSTLIEFLDDAILHNFIAVCINPGWVKFSYNYLKKSKCSSNIATVIGFPLGANTTEVKVYETKDAIRNGASEIDLVINISKAIEGDYSYVLEEIDAVVDVAGNNPVKVIIETCYFSLEQKKELIEVVSKSKATYIKTSTGFGTSGATIDDVALMKMHGGPLKIKAAGGVRDLETALKMINAGASRLGTSSSVKIVEEALKSGNK